MYRIALIFLIAIATHAAAADQSGTHNLRENEVEKIAKASEERFASLMAPDKLLNVVRRTHSGKYLTAIDFPVGALGGSVIRMNGKAEREWWHIFNNTEERESTGKVPNSFFGMRTHLDKEILVRALQTSSVGPFEPMQGLTFYSEYPFGYYDFVDENLPVSVSLETYSFLIPMDLKNSAIPCAIFRYKVKNTRESEVKVSLLAAQQNAVGFTGYDTIDGQNSRNCKEYGSNKNAIVPEKGRSSLRMTGDAGSMVLSAYESETTHAAAWESLAALHHDFAAMGRLSGPMVATSPHTGETVDGALAKGFTLAPGGEKTITFVLSWYIPKASFGKKNAPKWDFTEGGSQYENWWTDAADVDQYVFDHFKELDKNTHLYRNTLYSSNLPCYVLDRVSSNISVLKSPTAFWSKSGYFGLWESTSNNELWFGNCKHVYHYAQGHVRLFPKLGRLLRQQDLDGMTDDGLLPARHGDNVKAIDGHFGTILGIYREHLLSADKTFLKDTWDRVKKAMDYVIQTHDADLDGMLSGTYHNTLDCNVSGTSPWIGSLYLAALKASEQMAALVGDTNAAQRYASLFDTGRVNQDAQLWDDKLGYYKEKTENLPDTRVMADAVSIDMFLGQWWATQLGLGQIYPQQRTRDGLLKIYYTNRFTDTGSGHKQRFRDFLGTGDTGWHMFAYPGAIPKNTILYYDEAMSGFEYSMAATLIQYGLLNEGLSVVRAIYDRYDGRLRAEGEVNMENNSTVFGCGSPVGEDECGDFYGRPLSSWSTLLALQGFIYDGPEGIIGFKPVWQPKNHVSFFTGAEGWGVFSQQCANGSHIETLELKYGRLMVRELVFERAEGATSGKVTVQIGTLQVPVKTAITGSELRITFDEPIVQKAGETLSVEIR